LSQLENGRVTKPSPHILHALATVYRVPYETLMERAGYVTLKKPSEQTGAMRQSGSSPLPRSRTSRGRGSSSSRYLNFIRSQAKKTDGTTDDSRITPDCYRAICGSADRLLREASAYGRFPTPISDIIGAAKLSVEKDASLDTGFLRKLTAQQKEHQEGPRQSSRSVRFQDA